MDTDKLRHFCIVVQTGNLRRAAEILHISHSGLSKSIKALETELKTKLIVRDGRGITVSDAGKKLFERSPVFFESLKNLTASENTKEPSTLIRIGTFEVFSTYFFGSMIRDFMPDESFQLHEFIPGEMEEMLANHIIDVAITYEPIPRQGLDFTKIAQIQMGIFGRKDYLDNRTFENLDFASPVKPIQNTPTGTKGLDGWPEQKIPRNIKYQVDMMETGLEICRQGMAVIFAPTFVIELHNKKYASKYQLVEVDTGEKINVKRTVYMVRRKSSEETSDIRKIAQAIRRICS